jgi:hypothetical protein
MIDRAKHSAYIVLYENVGVVEKNAFIQSLIKSVLNKTFTNCKRTIDSVEYTDWCFRDLSMEIEHALSSKFGGSWAVAVGRSNRCHMYTDFKTSKSQEAYLYLLGDIYFELLFYQF